ncbi:polysaccharide biosynthesis tyrosine autokinase [Candidatus Omnitrophota bacterium]
MQQFEREVHLSDYLRIVKNRKKVLITFFFITVLIVTVSSFTTDPVYRATVTLFIDKESPDVLTTTGQVSLGVEDYYTYKEYFQSQREIIKSVSIVKRAFEEFNLGQQKAYLNAKTPLKDFLDTIKVDVIRDTRLLLLSVDNENPRLAADIANRIAEMYVLRNLSYITKTEVLNLLKNEYLKLQTRLSEYSKIYKHKHPKMVRLQQEIGQMTERLKSEKDKVGDYEIEEVPSMTTYTSSSVLSGLKANNIVIQDRAQVPVLPARPNKRLNILMSMIVGLLGGLGLAFFFEYLDDTIKGVEEIERLVHWPFLGSIRKFEVGSKISEREKDIFVHIKPKDPTSEAYRAIRTSVLFSITEEHPLKSIVITSPGPQEGKTMTLCNIGITMAQNRSRVLLVDADMRKPRLHKIFKKKTKIGLSSFLSGQSGFNEVVQETDINNLFLICSGFHPPDPSELISSRKMEDFIKIAKESFDFVIFDTPPMAVVTDAIILSKVADGIAVVLESGKTRRRMLPRIAKALQEARVRVIGVVLNKISLGGSDYQYYSSYYGKQETS